MTLDEVIETIEGWYAESGYGPEAASLAHDVLCMLRELRCEPPNPPNAAQQFAAAGEHFALAAEAGGVEVAVQPCVVACSTEDASTLVAAGLGGIVEDYGDGTALVSIGSREAGADDDRPDEFMRGFAEGARRAEAEAWEVLRDALAPDPLRGESEPILTLPDGVTLAAAVGHVAAALADMKRSGSKP